MLRTSMVSTVAAMAAAAVLLAGCGGGSPNSASHSSTAGGSFKSLVAQAYKYSDCIRSHGVPNFPDPHVVSTPNSQGIGIATVGKAAPAVRAASKACAKYAPSGGAGPSSSGPPRKLVQAEFVLARCLRSHGFPKFPDPGSQGEISAQQLQAAGINLSQPGFLSAAGKCLPATHGAITMAMLRQAIAHVGSSGSGGGSDSGSAGNSGDGSSASAGAGAAAGG